MNKIYQILCVLVLLASIGIVTAGTQEEILNIESHTSKSAFDTDVYFTGFDYIPGERTSTAIAHITVEFSNGDRENILLDLNGNEKQISHGVMFELYSHGIENTVVWEDGLHGGNIILRMAVISPDPTPIPTPIVTPSPSPSPTPSPTPTVVNIESNVTPTPVPEPQVIQYSSPFGTLHVNSTPKANVYFNDELAGQTPISRDFGLKGVNVKIKLDGFVEYNHTFIVRDGDDIPVDVLLSKIEPEVTPSEVKFSSIVEVPEEINTSENTTNATTQIVSEKSESVSFPTMLFVVALASVIGFIYIQHFWKKEQIDNASGVSVDVGDIDDRSSEEKILDLFTTKGMAKAIERDERTVQRVMKKLKEENRLPF